MPTPNSTTPDASAAAAVTALSPGLATSATANLDPNATPPVVPDYATPVPPSRKTWSAGSLTYTRTGLGMLFFWLLWGDFTLMLRDRSVGPSFTVVLKLYNPTNLVLALLTTFLPHAIGMVLGPIISYRSDRLRSRWGRRIPFLLVPTPLAFIGMVMLAYSPAVGHWLHAVTGGQWFSENTMVIAVMAVAWTMFEVCAIAAGSVFSGLINDVVPRELIGRFFGAFRVVSLGAGMIYMFFLMGQVKTHYVPIFIGIGALYAVSFSLMCFKVKEGQYPPPPPPDPDAANRSAIAGVLRGFVTYIRECFSHPYYRWVALGVALSMAAFAPINAFSYVYAKELGMTDGLYGKYSTMQFAVSLLQAYFIGWLADKIHPLRLILLSFLLHGTTVALAFFLVNGVTSFGVFHVLTGSCAGFWLTAYSPLLPALLPRNRFATISSAISVCTSLGTMLVSTLCGAFIDYTGNQYRYVFLWSLGFDALALLAMFVVYRRFNQYGGIRGYTAPE